MKATFISKENNIVKFTMDITAEEFEAEVVNVYKKNKNQFVIDGFRKGKAPRSIIEKMYGEGVFWEDAINALVDVNYGKAIDELGLEIIDYPKVNFSEIKKGEGFTVTVDVEVFPIVEVKDYKGVEVDQEKSEVTEEEMNDALEAARKRMATLEPVEGAAEDGDTVVLDYAGTVDGVAFEGGTAEEYTLVLGSGSFIPGFEEQLVGVAAEEEKDVVVTFPENYHAEELAGKEAVFKCKLHEIKREVLPELNDEFADEVSEFDTLEEYKADMKEKMFKNKEAAVVNAAKNALIDKITKANDVKVPAVLVENQITRTLNEMNQNLAMQGLSLDMYLQFMNKTEEDLREELKADCEARVASQIVLRGIVEAEKIEASEDEFEQEYKDLANMYNMDVEEVKQILESQKDQLKLDIQTRKAIDMIYAEAKINIVDKIEAADAE